MASDSAPAAGTVAKAADATHVTSTDCAAVGDTLYALLGAPAASQGAVPSWV